MHEYLCSFHRISSKSTENKKYDYCAEVNLAYVFLRNVFIVIWITDHQKLSKKNLFYQD